MDFETKQNNLTWYSLTYALPLKEKKKKRDTSTLLPISKWIKKEKPSP